MNLMKNCLHLFFRLSDVIKICLRDHLYANSIALIMAFHQLLVFFRLQIKNQLKIIIMYLLFIYEYMN